jgi:hypothetical protein
MTRSIRKSSFGDYFAIDYLNERGQILETPLYLKRGGEAPIKIRWDFSSFNSSGEHKQSCMIKGLARFDGEKIECSYNPDEMFSGGERYWWEPTDYEIKNFSIIHFKP